MSQQPFTLLSGQSLQSLAGELYQDTSFFRELANFNNLDILDFGESLRVNDLVEIGTQIQAQAKADVEEAAKQAGIQIRETLQRIEDEAVSTVNKVFGQIDIQDLDLSSLKTANGLSPQQLVSWLLGE